MRSFIFVAIVALCGTQLFAQEPKYPPLLTPPIAEEVVQVENMPDEAPIYIYSTGERKFICSREEILHFLTNGEIRAVDYNSQKLWDLAPLTPPRKLTERERQGFEEIVQTGALSTGDGSIYFWRKLNDRVLYLGQHARACYLILPEIKK